MKKMTVIKTICFLVLGSNSFAMYNDSNDSLIITAKGYGYQCRGFCSGSNSEDSELISRKNTDLNAYVQCKSEGYESAALIDDYECNSYFLSQYERMTHCLGTYRCE